MEEPLFRPSDGVSRLCAYPNFEYYSKRHQIIRGYRIQNLWEEYRDACERAGERPYAYSSFCCEYAKWRRSHLKSGASAWLPAECVHTWWAYLEFGDGSKRRVFVAQLAFSGYTFACPVADSTVQSWMRACAKAFRFFGGVPYVTDCNLLDNRRGDAIHGVLPTLQAFCTHYRTVLFASGPKVTPLANDAPKGASSEKHVLGEGLFPYPVDKDKPLTAKRTSAALNAVRPVFRQMPKIDDAAFEASLSRLLPIENARKGKADRSPYDAYAEQERGLLLSLPEEDFGFGEWTMRRVQSDYHFHYNRVRYSVPYHYAFDTVRVHREGSALEVYSAGSLIAAHEIPESPKGRLIVTNPKHRPPSHAGFAKRLDLRFGALAQEIGPNTAQVMKRVLEACHREEGGFRPCKDLCDLRLRPSATTLEEACGVVLKDEGNLNEQAGARGIVDAVATAMASGSVR